MDEKARLRREMIARRDALPQAELARIAEALTASLTALPQYAGARSVLATMSIGSEWSTRAFLDRARADGKIIVLVRLTAPPRRLELHSVADMERGLVPGVWNIPEPDPARNPRVQLGEVDFAVIPALAVDRSGYRLGYGAGYFDGLLTGRGARPFCVTALPAAFVMERVPREPHDVAVDFVVSELGPVPIKAGRP
ncbi:MAG TPA: 5-formyltetrahydrofolate cyclo-ligase [Usitatibacter sp.]|nr:5-formyltetrahydrofolate cyclo-ligase [Usitatibacter sp.]